MKFHLLVMKREGLTGVPFGFERAFFRISQKIQSFAAFCQKNKECRTHAEFHSVCPVDSAGSSVAGFGSKSGLSHGGG
ncbi:MAG TPA: hypothetical protein VHE33_01855, partial [Acidobacteriaceae bacterium]|nr:hypothetical protein [Acidobacteriaceae bacterium]